MSDLSELGAMMQSFADQYTPRPDEEVAAEQRRQSPAALSRWFPKLVAADLPVPKTHILPMSDAAVLNMWDAFDNNDGGRDDSRFYAALEKAAQAVGLPCFLRTDYTSYKHDWKHACYLTDPTAIKQHVHEIAEFSAFQGMPWGVWCVREFLPTIPYAVLPGYGDMPLTREFRCFVRAGDLLCVHPYWPQDSVEQGGAPPDIDYEGLCETTDAEMIRITELACAAGKAVGGEWSVDILETKRGWYITDMAEAHASAHWEGCPNREILNSFPTEPNQPEEAV